MNYMDVMVNKYGKELAMELIEELLDWRDIEGYEGLYRVSEWGDVMSIGHGKKKLLKPQQNGHGYLQVSLSRNGIGKKHQVHRLVAAAFCEGAGEFPEVNHKDEDKTNNNYNNLEWCTHNYNTDYGTRNERMLISGAGRQRVKVRCIELDTIYDSACEAERCTHADNSHIIACCKGKRNIAGGYHWEYID